MSTNETAKPNFSLEGKIALVTGGTGALGTTFVKTLANAGATVLVVGLREAEAIPIVTEINDNGGTAEGFGCDVLDLNAVKALATTVKERYGRVDILLNGAGGNRPDATAVPGQRTFFDLPPEAMRWVFDLNLMGTILPSQIFGEMMAEQGHGNIINISSMSSMQPLTRVVAYSAAKAAINNFTQWLAVTLATEHSSSIRVNAIAPGFFIGAQNRFLLLNEDDTLTDRGQTIIDHTPMDRFGEPDDLSGTLLWLASDASRFVTGIVVPVDGGFSAFSGV